MALQNDDIAERIRELRQRRGNPPQPVVADAVGVALRTYQNWEAGDAKPSYRYLQELAKYHGVGEDFILSGTEEPAPRTETPDPFAASATQEQLDRIQAELEAARDERQDLRDQIAQQNKLLARQSKILERIETLVRVLDDAEVIALAEAAAADDGVEQALASARQRLLATDPPARSKPRRTGSGSG